VRSSSSTSAARLVVSGLSLGATGSDVLPGSSGIDTREVDVRVDPADDGAQHYQNEQYDQSDEHDDVAHFPVRS